MTLATAEGEAFSELPGSAACSRCRERPLRTLSEKFSISILPPNQSCRQESALIKSDNDKLS